MLVAGGEIDIVVADAEARHGGEPAVRRNDLAREAVREQDQRVAVLEAASPA